MRTEDRLREALQTLSEQVVAPQLTWDSVSRSVRRRAQARRAASLGVPAASVAALAAVLLLFSGLTRGRPATPSSPTPRPSTTRGTHLPERQIVSWSPIPVASLGAGAVRRCRPPSLRVRAYGWGGATGSLVGGIGVINTSNATCAIVGRPRVLSVSDSNGRPLPIEPRTSRAPRRSPRLLLDPGQTANAMVVWADWCRRSPGKLRLTVAVPGFPEPQRVDVGGGRSVPCSDPSISPSTLRNGTFVNVGYDSSSAPGRLRLHLEAPPEAAEGTTLHFVVAITNPTSRPVRLDPCPAYRATLYDPGEIRERYRLNCEPIGGVIGPGRTERFAMELPVPPTFLDRIELKLGRPVHRWRAYLEWAFVPSQSQAADSRIWVVSD